MLSGHTVGEVDGVGCICVLLVHRYLPHWLADIHAKIIDTPEIQIKQKPPVQGYKHMLVNLCSSVLTGFRINFITNLYVTQILLFW